MDSGDRFVRAAEGGRTRSEIVRWSAITLTVLLVIVLLAIGASAEDDDEIAAGAGSVQVAATPTTEALASGATLSTDAQAYGELLAHADAGWASIQPVRGQWAALVGSHVVLSPSQPAARPSGKATVDSSPIVLAEYEDLVNRFDTGDAKVLLVRRTAYGPAAVDDQFTLVTIVDDGFGSQSEAQDWCDEHYAGLAVGADRDGACSPVQLQQR